MNELAVELRHELGVLEHDLRHERPCLEIPPALELEEIALRTDDGSLRESFEQSGLHAHTSVVACTTTAVAIMFTT